MKENSYFVAFKTFKNNSITFGMGDINIYPYHMSKFELDYTRDIFAKKLNIVKDSLTIINF